MKSLFRSVLISALALTVSVPLAQEGHAQETQVTPLPLPSIDAPPPPPSGTQVTSDPNAAELLTYLVEISRLFGGGIIQIFSAVAGPKPFPVMNGQSEIAARQGGPGLWEMATTALSGGQVRPDSVQTALTEFRNKYHLDKAFALIQDPSFSNVIAAQASAQGAIAASTAEASYKSANASMDRISTYIAALQGSGDLKTSIDINTRVMIEVAQQLNETLRTQSAIASMAGTYFMALGADAADPDSFDLRNFNR